MFRGRKNLRARHLFDGPGGFGIKGICRRRPQWNNYINIAGMFKRPRRTRKRNRGVVGVVTASSRSWGIHSICIERSEAGWESIDNPEEVRPLMGTLKENVNTAQERHDYGS